MKFITSTHLKQWADTKECQSLLPELVRRLIFASVKQLDRLSFPSGDAVHLPGWDGIVSCRESIDLVPDGESLWECGSDRNFKTKANNDISKRVANPLGHNQSTSTFVFVTPREWPNVNTWILDHQDGWKKIVVYSAVELEAWIEKCPSVGLWLADKLNILKAGGYQLPDVSWDQWASCDKYTLPYKIVTSGRERETDCVLKACSHPCVLEVQALTQTEAIAFVLASIATCNDADRLWSKTIVVTSKDTLDDLVSHYENLIIVTSLLDNMPYALAHNHTIIRVVTPVDHVPSAVKLPKLEREGFIKSLEECGFDSVQASKIAKDTARDVTVLRRRLEIDKQKPEWANSEGISALLPIILLGQWDENIPGDLELVEKFSRNKYSDYVETLQHYCLMSDSPIAHIGSVWRLKSPLDAMSYASPYLSSGSFAKLKEICVLLIADDDTEAVEKLSCDEWKMWQSKQHYSSNVKKGTFQSLILLSLTDDANDSRLMQIESLVKELLNGWTLQRFLSNRMYLTLLAEASPEAFLDFLETTSKDIYDVVFTPHKSTVGGTGWNIYYTEILFSLEMLAWDEDYILRATSLLLQFSTYKNESNYSNKPINSLAEIFRFQLPQTFVNYENKIKVLTSLSSSFKSQICELCFRILDTLGSGAFMQTHFYKWKHFNDYSSPQNTPVSVANVKAITKLLLNCTTFSENDVCKLLKLSTNKWMNCCRNIILDAIVGRKESLYECDVVAHELRDVLTHHLSFPDAAWALSETDLIQYQKLLSDIESRNVVKKYRWMFEDMFLRLPQRREMDYMKEAQMVLQVRNKAVNEILSERGKDGLWELVSVSKCPSSVVNSMIQLYGDGLLEDVCKKYCEKIVDHTFLQSFFSNLFYTIGEEDFVKIVNNVYQYGNICLSTCLYAPGYNEKLASIATDCGEIIETLYWQNVRASYVKTTNLVYIIDKLVVVNRYEEALELIYHNKESDQLTDIIKVSIIQGLLFKSQHGASKSIDWFVVDSVIEDLDKSEDPGIVQALIQIEFFAYRAFKQRRNINELRLIKELMTDPSLLVELMVMAFTPDDDMEIDGNELEQRNKDIMARCAFNILYDLPCCPGVDTQGNVDSSALRTYINRLYELSVERHRSQVVDMVVGNLLGNLPRNETYPQPILGEIVEKLKSDSVDRHIRIRIFNSRGVTTRGFTEGGDQERLLVALFKKYHDKVKFSYPRLAKIFSQLIQEYEHDAYREDYIAQLEDYEY